MKTAGRSLAGCPGWEGHCWSVQAVASACLHLRPHQHPSGRGERWATLQGDSASGPCVLSTRVESNIDERNFWKWPTGAANYAFYSLKQNEVRLRVICEFKHRRGYQLCSSSKLTTLCETKCIIVLNFNLCQIILLWNCAWSIMVRSKRISFQE